ncbi:GDP-L-fucose synthase [Ursidibacter maritimus]|uniref:GDP-L-fucose synthase n=2 Tax=Ursidibacter maritimus TaxID=1331689 RepID=A0A949T2U2_9PAST|nr:GDP-L-fucose synthase [Ursidibacter maritimus]KAE9540640.1 GDP-L-fucose synthase [Ursidibacter maritimus]MBV6524054.1 GDP-L-fucose synthase [Ursidibacter maritimus]MBV6525002.1 GDP-L-fucose synthase [Ursidibacter maritimus]MBV6527204.1 GDP-L-fucose synthase [Ursidibacter maritimus]MBV6529868.1 GDP-L-fucose synthase [Ursidibacter maritimus]
MKKVTIIGLGWLGMPLGETLIQQGWIVKGSKREVTENSEGNLMQYPLLLTANFPITSEVEQLLNSDALVINIPPSKINEIDYIDGIKRLVSHAILQKVKHIVFVSSTSVFPQKNGHFDENAIPFAEDKSAQTLLAVENWLLSQQIDVDIVRLAGLVGKKRHPVYYLAGKTELKNALQPVNLVHLDDCIRAIICLLNAPNGKRIYHLVAPIHPTREEYYRFVAKQCQLADLHFLEDKQPLIRVIHGEKICRDFGFSYQYDAPIKMIPN